MWIPKKRRRFLQTAPPPLMDSQFIWVDGSYTCEWVTNATQSNQLTCRDIWISQSVLFRLLNQEQVQFGQLKPIKRSSNGISAIFIAWFLLLFLFQHIFVWLIQFSVSVFITLVELLIIQSKIFWSSWASNH